MIHGPIPSQNTTEIDEVGLNGLHYYVPSVLHNEPSNYAFGSTLVLATLVFDPAASNLHPVMPSLADYERMYGVVAASLTSISLGGDHGIVEVPTTGSPPRPVYVVRVYILATVVVVIVTVPLLTVLSLLPRVVRPSDAP